MQLTDSPPRGSESESCQDQIQPERGPMGRAKAIGDWGLAIADASADGIVEVATSGGLGSHAGPERDGQCRQP